MSQSKRPAPKGAVPPRGGKGGGRERASVPPRQGSRGKSLGRPAATRPSGGARPQSPSSSGEARQAGWERRRAQRRQRNLFIGVGVAVVAIVAALVIVRTVGGSGSGSSDQLAAGVYGQVTGVPVSDLVSAAETVPTTGATGNGVSTPGAINGPPSLGGSHPTILYVGAEYCPYCAAERWPLVMALSKVGTLSGLRQTTSSSTDTNANTPTFSFVDARFSSPYLNFTARETEDRQGKPLQQLTPEESALVKQYDAAPYVPSSAAGTIPFILFGSQFVVSGAQYDASAIAGKSMTDASAALTASQTPNPNATGTAAAAQGAKAVAGHLLGAICAITDNRPSVCASVPANLKPTGATAGGQGSQRS